MKRCCRISESRRLDHSRIAHREGSLCISAPFDQLVLTRKLPCTLLGLGVWRPLNQWLDEPTGLSHHLPTAGILLVARVDICADPGHRSLRLILPEHCSGTIFALANDR